MVLVTIYFYATHLNVANQTIYIFLGTCGKGDRCKFSHDLEIERKAEKRSLYCDVRDDTQEGTSEDWDEDKLKEVVEKKHAEADKKKTKTDIVSI